MGNTLHETFPHNYDDGYHYNGKWNEIEFWRIYKYTKTMPKEWNKAAKKKKIISEFIVGQQRGEREGDNCWYGCNLIYKFSSN